MSTILNSEGPRRLTTAALDTLLSLLGDRPAFPLLWLLAMALSLGVMAWAWTTGLESRDVSIGLAVAWTVAIVLWWRTR